MVVNLPKLSVIMPVYNAERYLAAAIDSILNQTYTDFEFIIIDDCSTDKSYLILQKYQAKDKRIKLFRNAENYKQAYSRNLGIEQAVGSYIVFMDADDISLPERFTKQLNFMLLHPEVDISGVWYTAYNDDFSLVLYHQNDPVTHWEIVINMHLLRNAFAQYVIVKKSVFHDLRYNIKFANIAEDYELWLRVIDKGYILANLNEYLVNYRVYPQSSCHQFSNKVDNYIQEVHKKYLQQLFGDMYTDEIADVHTELIYRNKSMCYFFKNIFRYRRHLVELKKMNELNNIYPRDDFNAVMLQLSPIYKIYNKIVKVISSKLRCN